MDRRTRQMEDRRGDAMRDEAEAFGARFSDYNIIAAYPDMGEAKKAIDALQLAGIEAAEYSLLGGTVAEAESNVDKASVHEADAKLTNHILRNAVIGAVAGAALARDSVLPTFFGRPAPKDHGPEAKAAISQAIFEGDAPLVRPGRRVAIVEDVVTQGGAAMQAVDVALGEGCEVTLVMCMVERHEGGGARFRERGIAFKRLFYTLDDGSLHVDAELE